MKVEPIKHITKKRSDTRVEPIKSPVKIGDKPRDQALAYEFVERRTAGEKDIGSQLNILV